MRKHTLLPALLFVAVALHAVVRTNFPTDNTLEKPLYFDPFGQTGLFTLAII